MLNRTNTFSGKGKRIALVLAAAAALTAGTHMTAFADDDDWHYGYYNGATGGFTGPGPATVTVEQAKGMRDDSRVALRGNIVQSLDGKHFLFRDASGEIVLEISHKHWYGQTIGPEDQVEIYGEVEKDWTRVEIDVKRIVKL